MQSSPSVTVVSTARDRFSLAARSLASIFEHTRIPFTLVWVDCNYPDRYRKEIATVLAGHDNVRIVRLDHYSNAAEQKNAAAKGCTDDYLCFIENDNIVSPGWLERMLEACETLAAGACSPQLIDGNYRTQHFHHDGQIGHIRIHDENGVITRSFEPDTTIQERLNWTEPRIIDITENHVTLFRREAFSAYGGFDERLTSRQFCDTSLMLHEKGIRVALAPMAVVRHYPPPPVRNDEWTFYTFIWNIEAARRSEQLIKEKWALRELPSSVPFVIGQYRRRSWLGFWVLGTIFRGERLLYHVKRIFRNATSSSGRLKKSS